MGGIEQERERNTMGGIEQDRERERDERDVSKDLSIFLLQFSITDCKFQLTSTIFKFYLII